MGEVVNLRTARKQAKRRKDAEQAAANRLAFGQPKEERTLASARSKKARRDLDQHRIDNGDGE